MLIFCRVLNLERAFQFLSTLMKFRYDAIPLMLSEKRCFEIGKQGHISITFKTSGCL
jgi:hypothetical protein